MIYIYIYAYLLWVVIIVLFLLLLYKPYNARVFWVLGRHIFWTSLTPPHGVNVSRADAFALVLMEWSMHFPAFVSDLRCGSFWSQVWIFLMSRAVAPNTSSSRSSTSQSNLLPRRRKEGMPWSLLIICMHVCGTEHVLPWRRVSLLQCMIAVTNMVTNACTELVSWT